MPLYYPYSCSQKCLNVLVLICYYSYIKFAKNFILNYLALFTGRVSMYISPADNPVLTIYFSAPLFRSSSQCSGKYFRQAFKQNFTSLFSSLFVAHDLEVNADSPEDCVTCWIQNA